MRDHAKRQNASKVVSISLVTGVVSYGGNAIGNDLIDVAKLFGGVPALSFIVESMTGASTGQKLEISTNEFAEFFRGASRRGGGR